MRLRRQTSIRGLLVLEELLEDIYIIGMMFIFIMQLLMKKRYQSRMLEFRGVSRVQAQLSHLSRLYMLDDDSCIEQLRMDRRTFGILCQLLREVGLGDSKYVTLEEQVTTFVSILAHHTKNRVAKFNFLRSGQTVSKHFNVVLNGVLKLHKRLLKKPEPVRENSTDYRWKWFKNYLGALDGTHIKMRVPATDKPRYRSRKETVRKRGRSKGDENIAEMTKVFGRFVDSSEAKIDKLYGRLGHEVDVSMGNKTVNSELRKIASLTKGERFKALSLITDKSSRLDAFLSLDEDDREDWVRMLIDAEI